MAINTAIKTYKPDGANFYQVDTVQQFRLGELGFGENNSQWEYVQNTSASVAINAFECVGYNSDYKAAAVASSATSDAAKFRNCGWPQVKIPASNFGWVCKKASGGLKIKVAASVAANAQLFIGASAASAGVITGASSTNTVKLFGVVLVVAAGSSGTTSIEAIANYPRFGAVS